MSIINATKSYLPHIDGLRAIAVIFVIIYHYFRNKLVGGFVGVDIFFVISGYLISKILFKEFINNKFSILNFYIRRIIRIFPALLFSIILVLIVGYFCLLQHEYGVLMVNLFRSLLFYNNIWHGTTSTFSGIGLKTENDYFSPNTDLDLTNHLWSLAIEEQFYIFWPWFLFLIFRFIKNKLVKFFFICTAFIISFGINIYLVKDYPAGTFFMPFTRFWELIFGGILAYSETFFTQKLSFLETKKFHNFASIFAIFLFFYSAFKFDENIINFPGYLAFLPTFGAFLIIFSKKSFINEKILSNKLLVNIGLISYPLYLWHWIFWSFGRILQGELSVEKRLFLIFLSFLFAVITYFFVERPIRFGVKKRDKILKTL